MPKRMANLALPILLAALVYLLITGQLFSSSPFVITAQVVAIGLSVWARRSFGAGQFNITAEPKAGPLLSTGPYQWIRHPMYAAALLLLWSSILGHWSLIPALVGLLVTGALLMRIAVEEQFLRTHFPGYAAYAHKTKRIVPFII